MIKLGVISPNINDTTSLYRAGGPFSMMRNVDVTFLEKANNISLMSNDVIFMQRPFNEMHLNTAKMVKRCGLPLWIDYDDFLFDVPKDNPSYSLYMNEKVHSNLIQLLNMSDVVTVSTNTLHDLHKSNVVIDGVSSPLAKNVIVLPNCYDYRFHGEINDPTMSKVITWRGSKTHDRDLFEYGEEIVRFMSENLDWKIHFLGHNPWQITDKINENQYFIHESTDPFMYIANLKRIGPSVHIVPLHDSIFNRSKSNIAWIEATVAGAATICPAWDGWVNEGALNYSTKEKFYELLSDCAKELDMVKDSSEKSFKCIKSKYNLIDVNNKRFEIIQSLAV